MTFFSPWLAGIVAAVAVPSLLILYFLKLRRRDVEVSTTILWKKSIQDLQANAPFQKLRRNILLLLQLIALAAILLALAQPELKSATASSVRHVLLIDRSASMSATDGAGPGNGNAAARTRLEQAKRDASGFIDTMRDSGVFGSTESGDQAMVIAFDTSAEVRQVFTGNKSELKAAIDAIEPTDAPTSLQEAFKLAKAYFPKATFEENKGFVAHGDPAVIHLFSDGRLPDADRITPDPEDQVYYHAVGEEGSGNLAITSLRTDRAFSDPAKLSIFVGLENTFPDDRTVDVELLINGVSVRVRPVTLPGATLNAPPPAAAANPPPSASPPVGEGGDAQPATGAPPPPAAPAQDRTPGVGGVVFSLERAEGGTARVRLASSDPDPLPVDDSATVIMPPAKRLAVALVTDGSYFLSDMLESLDLSRLEKFSHAEFQQMVDGKQVRGLGVGDFDVTVLDRALPLIKSSTPSAPSPPVPTPALPAAPGTPAATAAPTPPPPSAPNGPAPRIPPGRSLVLGVVPPPPLGLIDLGPGETTVMADWSRDHAALKYARLGELVIFTSRKVKVQDGSPVQVIARDQNGPAIVEAGDDTARAIIVPWDPGQTDWPLKPDFLAFLAYSLQYLAQAGSESAQATIRPGDTLTDRVPITARDVTLRPPPLGGAEAATIDLQPAPDGRVAFGPLRRAGVYTLAWTGPAGPTDTVSGSRVVRSVAVNLLDPDESQIAARSTIGLASRIVRSQEGERAIPRKLWPYLLIAALAVVLFEWFVYNRKVQI